MKPNRNQRAETARFIQWMNDKRPELMEQYQLRRPPASFPEYCAHVWRNVRHQHQPEAYRSEYQAQR